MNAWRLAAVPLAAASVIALSGCNGPYGARGDRGLAPAPEAMPYTNVYRGRPDDHPPLKSRAEQERIERNLDSAAGRLNRRRV